MSNIANKAPRRVEQMPWHVLRGNIENIPKDFDELIKNYPTLEGELTNKKFSISQDEDLKVEFTVTHHFHATGAVSFTPTETQVRGKKDSGIQQVALKEAHVISRGNRIDLKAETK